MAGKISRRSLPIGPSLELPDPSESRPSPGHRMSLGTATPRGFGQRPRLSPEAAAAFATMVDSARARAAIEGRTLVYTVRWSDPVD